MFDFQCKSKAQISNQNMGFSEIHCCHAASIYSGIQHMFEN